MKDMMYFDKTAGDDAAVNEQEHAIFLGTPDTVRLPPELGGNEVRVLREFVDKCPCGGGLCRHLELEGGFFVAESNQFYWYRRQ